MAVTVTLKDAQDNAVTGASSLLTAETVTVQHAVLKAGSGWKDNGDGTYTATYTAITAGTDLRAAVKLPGWSAAAESGAYIIYGTATLKDISVNGYTFRPDEGFPTSGFKGAEFTLNLESDSGGSTSDYTWTADAPWVSVTDGVVRFTGKGTGNKVTITGTPKSGQGRIIKYSFALKSWFINNSSNHIMNWSAADAYCTSQSGYSLPTVAQMSNGGPEGEGQSRAANAGLWSEWGTLSSYSGSGFVNDIYWSSDPDYTLSKYNVGHYYARLDNGIVTSSYDWDTYSTVCRQGL
ncbi:hypothetical protein CYD30_28515 [Kosakonia cowanii]|nr:hypothetical protein CYD30_28515 [Kosakonia cowanii]